VKHAVEKDVTKNFYQSVNEVQLAFTIRCLDINYSETIKPLTNTYFALKCWLKYEKSKFSKNIPIPKSKISK
jgi:hypothetical protein